MKLSICIITMAEVSSKKIKNKIKVTKEELTKLSGNFF
jgi:hypothetical protein